MQLHVAVAFAAQRPDDAVTSEVSGGPLPVRQLGNVASGPVSSAVAAEVRGSAGVGHGSEVRCVHDSSIGTIRQGVNLNLT